jgi:hypothetical protein
MSRGEGVSDKEGGRVSRGDAKIRRDAEGTGKREVEDSRSENVSLLCVSADLRVSA